MNRVLHLACVTLLLAACSDSTSPTVEPPDDTVPDPPAEALTFDRLLAGEFLIHRPERSPLTAVLIFETTEPVRARVEVRGDLPLTHSVDQPTSSFHLPVVGLYPGERNRVVVELVTSEGVEVSREVALRTDALPDFFPGVTLETARPSRMEPGWNVSSFSVGVGDRFLSWPFAFDANGEVRWYLDLSGYGGIVYAVERLRNGNLLFGHGHSVYEFDWLGNRLNQWDFPGYLYHHDVIEKEDGNLIVAVDLAGGETVEDHVIEVDRQTGDVVRVWDFREILDPARTTYMDNPTDWFHMNAVWWDEDDEALIVSGRNQSAVVKVTAEGEVVWILSAHRGWGVRADGTDLSQYLLTAVDAAGNPLAPEVQDGAVDGSAFRWPWGQHAPMILPNGNLFLFDNGLNPNFLFTQPGAGYSRGVEYAIDEDEGTIRQVWQYGRERGHAYYSSIISDVDYLPATGNRLIMPGITEDDRAYVTEVDADGDVVFEAAIRMKNLLGSGVQAWGQFDLVYRSERMAVY